MTMIEPIPAAADPAGAANSDIRHDWSEEEAAALLAAPLADLVFRAQDLHRRYQQSNEVEMATLVNIKDGGCPEDCHYCSQSLSWEGGVKAEALMPLGEVVEAARRAKAAPTACAWARPGAAPTSATSARCATWCARCAPRGWKPA